MTGSGKLFNVTRVKDRGVIKDHGPANAPLRKSVGIGMKTDGGNLRFFEVSGEERMRRLEMKNSRSGIRAGAQDFIERSVEGNEVAYTETLDATSAKRVGISGNQFPVMFFAAKAKNGHAEANQRAALCVCCAV